MENNSSKEPFHQREMVFWFSDIFCFVGEMDLIMPNNQPIMQDQELLNDVLTTQKLITSNYNTFANECTSQKLRDETVCLLHEEHDIGADIFNEMHGRGWYPTPAAEQQKITDAKTKFQNIKM